MSSSSEVVIGDQKGGPFINVQFSKREKVSFIDTPDLTLFLSKCFTLSNSISYLL